MTRVFFVLKIKGKAKIPDYVQLRDEEYKLIAYFRLDRPEKALSKAGFAANEDEMMQFIHSIEYGSVSRLEINLA